MRTLSFWCFFGQKHTEECRVDTLDDQVKRAYQQYQSRESDLLKNSFLQSLKCGPNLQTRAFM